VIVALPTPAVACTLVGASAGPYVLTAADGADAGLSPYAFVATAVNVYDTPLLRPVRVPLCVPGLTGTVMLCPPGDAVTR